MVKLLRPSYSGYAKDDFYILYFQYSFQTIHDRYLFSKIKLVLLPTLYKFIVWACWAKTQPYLGSKPKLVLTERLKKKKKKKPKPQPNHHQNQPNPINPKQKHRKPTSKTHGLSSFAHNPTRKIQAHLIRKPKPSNLKRKTKKNPNSSSDDCG